jgi:hypothetical protein
MLLFVDRTTVREGQAPPRQLYKRQRARKGTKTRWPATVWPRVIRGGTSAHNSNNGAGNGSSGSNLETKHQEKGPEIDRDKRLRKGIVQRFPI